MSIITPKSCFCESKSFALTGEKLYLSEDLADIHFVFETDGIVEKVPGHKLLLSSSDVFRAMFTGMWKEKDEVTIGDTNPDAFKDFLQFFYRNKVYLTFEHIGDVMTLVNMYNVIDGMSNCVRFITRHLNSANVCLAYPPAILLEQEKLIKYCDYIVKVNTTEVLASPSFMECDREVLKHILNLNVFSCKEDHVFEQCINWVKAKAKVDNLTRDHIQQHLGELFYKFRFNPMSPEELVDLFRTYEQLFSPEECKDLLTLAASKTSKIFTDEYRRFNGGDIVTTVCRFYEHDVIHIVPHHLRNIESTTFSVNEPILLKGIALNKVFSYTGPKNIPNFTSSEDYDQLLEPTDDVLTEISIFEGFNDEKIHYEVACLKNKTNAISLNKEILIKPDTKYKIQMELELNGRSICAYAYAQEEIQLQPNITVKLCDYQIIDGDQYPRSLISVLAIQNLTN